MLEFNPVNPLVAKAGWAVNQRDHRKLLVVDGRSAVLGGINISSVYSSSGGSSGSMSGGSRGGDKKSLPWRDTDLLIEGPVVAPLQKLFMETWQAQKGKPLAPRQYFPPLQTQGQEVVRAIGSAPDEPFSQIYVTLISAINSAESEILVTNAYFVPDPQLMQALIGAAARGVDVKLILPSTTDSSLVFHAGRAHYEPLLRGGVKLYERREALLHAKTVVDRRRLGDGRLDQSGLAQLPTQPGVDRRHSGRRNSARRCAQPSSATWPHPNRSHWRLGSGDRSRRAPRKCSLDSGSTGCEHPDLDPHPRRRLPRPVGRASFRLLHRRRTPPRCGLATRRFRTSSPTTSSVGRSCSSRSRRRTT